MAVSAARFAADSLRVLPRERLSRAIGRMADLGGPRALVRAAIDAFVQIYGVDMSEVDVPAGGFASFDDFFTRRLRNDARRLDPDPNAVLSPADGRVDDLGRIEVGAKLQIKGQPYEAAELLGDRDDALGLEGGAYFVVYLHPRDYHRVHAPVSGQVTHVRHMPGTLYPVNDVGVQYIDRLFVRNERVAVFMESERYGKLAVVMVGAMSVGKIELSFEDVRTNDGGAGGLRRYPDNPPMLQRGDELGVFHLGSTVIVFLPDDVSDDFTAIAGEHTKQGQAVLRRSADVRSVGA